MVMVQGHGCGVGGIAIMFGAWPWYMGHGSLCSLPIVSELPVEVLKTQLGALKLLSR